MVLEEYAPYDATVEKCMSFLTEGVPKAKSNTASEPSMFHFHWAGFLPYISLICHAVCITISGLATATDFCQVLSEVFAIMYVSFGASLMKSGNGSLSTEIIRSTSSLFENISISMAPT